MSGAQDKSEEKQGLAARVADAFVTSRLTPLLAIVSLMLGAFAVVTTAKEEEPTVEVPAFDIFLAYPARGSEEIDARIARPVARWLREIPAVEHVYSTAAADAAMIGVQFAAGIPVTDALTSVNEQLERHRGELPEGAMPPQIVSRSAADVPALTLALHSDRDDVAELGVLARALSRRLEGLPDVTEVSVAGDSQREFRVTLREEALAAYGIDAGVVVQGIQAANAVLPAGNLSGRDGSLRVEAGTGIESIAQLREVVVGEQGGSPITLRMVADVEDTLRAPRGYVGFATSSSMHPAVVLEVRKVVGSNAAQISDRVRQMLEESAELLPGHVHVEFTTDAGVTATQRVHTLLEHMVIATLVVVLLIGLTLGRREAVIVAVVIPVTLAIVPFIYQLTGYTLNRITLAAMIFAIGILVDDAIVVVENVHRHLSLPGERSRRERIIDAVKEIGNPTILATFTVIAALVPTAFVSGMIGQYIAPLPIGAAVAMFYSLIIAFTVTPYLSYRLIASHGEHDHQGDEVESRYRSILAWFVSKSGRMFGLYGTVLLLLAGCGGLIAGGIAIVKLLPRADAQDASVVFDLEPNATKEETYAVGRALAAELTAEIPELENLRLFAGRPGPLDFQGVVRRNMLRFGANQGELQLRLVPRGERDAHSHEVAGEIRRVAEAFFAEQSGAQFTVAEPPPGPPVLATLVAEVYGPDEESRNAAAEHMRELFELHPGVVDVQSTLRETAPVSRVRLDPVQSAARGLVPAQVALGLRARLAGVELGEVRQGGPEGVSIRVVSSEQTRGSLQALEDLPIPGPLGTQRLGSVAELEATPGAPPRLRADMLPMVVVSAELRGDGAPAYAQLDMAEDAIAAGITPQWNTDVPDVSTPTLRWAGEWTTTYEMFRDLGLAFLVVLFAIYVMLVAWYGSYVTPFAVMLPIPLSFVGVVPAHAVLGMPLSGMATIGIIALAGLMVRNSILLVDFAQARIEAGHSPREAVLEAGAMRARPIILTALTVVLGDGVLFFDPLLQGLGLTMASGAVVSTLLTLGLVPVAYYQIATWGQRET